MTSEAPAPHARRRRRALVYGGVSAIAAMAAIAFVIRAAGFEHGDPARCPRGLVALGPRCCGLGQLLTNGACSGTPSACASGMHGLDAPSAGCVASDRRVSFTGGSLRIAQNDWEPQSQVDPREVRVGPFELDAHEVTTERWQRCSAAGGCRTTDSSEPGVPITLVTPSEALQFCRFYGGRLPTAEEWLFAAAGPQARSYPWGQTGLVCRRSAFGLSDGPCAVGAKGPEIVGSRPDGRSPEGVFDLSGNVAEWTLESPSKSGRPEFAARGGSFRSKVAPELKTWSAETTNDAAAHIGFRCAYAPG